MQKNFQNLNFTRYIYQNIYISNKDRNTFYKPNEMIIGDFDQFILSNTIYPFGFAINRNNRLAIRIILEPFKNFNSKSKGVVLYLQNEVPNRKDETGLRPAKFIHTYYGDFYKFNNDGIKIKDLVLCQAIPKSKELIIDIYYGYYPEGFKELNELINQHQWHKKTSNRAGLKSFKTFVAINK